MKVKAKDMLERSRSPSPSGGTSSKNGKKKKHKSKNRSHTTIGVLQLGLINSEAQATKSWLPKRKLISCLLLYPPLATCKNLLIKNLVRSCILLMISSTSHTRTLLLNHLITTLRQQFSAFSDFGAE